MRRERGEKMEMMLLAARPREIEREIEYANGFQIIQETVCRDNWGNGTGKYSCATNGAS